MMPLAHAEEADRNQPIEINADQGSLDQNKQMTVFSGNVVITQGSLKITADRVQVQRDNSGNQLMQASGKPVTFRQKLEGKSQYVSGQANQVEYASATGRVLLTGNAKVEREGDLASGHTISYNMRTEVYTVAGSQAAKGPGRRVTVILQPNRTGKK